MQHVNSVMNEDAVNYSYYERNSWFFISHSYVFQSPLLSFMRKTKQKYPGSGGIRTHASEETGALNQRLRPLGHATDSIKWP